MQGRLQASGGGNPGNTLCERVPRTVRTGSTLPPFLLKQERCKEDMRIRITADRFQAGERPFHLLNFGDHIRPGKCCKRIIIRLVPGLLEFDKGLRHNNNIPADGWDNECRRGSVESCQVSALESGTYLLHIRVDKRAPELCPQIGRVRRRQYGGRFGDQRMEQGVISSRDGSPQAGLAWMHRFPVGEETCLLQQVVVKSQVSTSLHRRIAEPHVRPPVYIGVQELRPYGLNEIRQFMDFVL